MRIDYTGVDAVSLGKHFELLGYATGCDSFAETVQEDIP